MLTNIPNHYTLLGVLPTATKSEINSAYRKNAKKFHPDKNNGSAESTWVFQQLLEAKNMLCDAKKRLEYDYDMGFKIGPVPISFVPAPKQKKFSDDEVAIAVIAGLLGLFGRK